MKPFIEGRKIRVAVVGCGRISRKHFGAIEQNSDAFELTGVCDTNPEVLAAHKETYKVPGYHKLEDLLAQNDCDLVSLATPSGLHAQEAIMTAKYGRHVMTEKPMATHWQEGLDMVRACDDAGVFLFVIKQNRLNPTLQAAKRAVNEGRFGKIYMVTVNVFWSRPQEYYDSAAWRGTWEMDGGAIMNQASHYIDLLDWLIGPIADVQAMTGTLARNIQVEDSGVLNVRWRSGALGSVAVTMLTYPKNMEGSITILGEKGSVRIGGVAVNRIEHWEFAEPADYDASVRENNYVPASVYGNGHDAYFRNVAETLRGRATPDTDGREGLKSLELIIAAYLSARDRKTVSLPLHYL